MNFWGSFLTFMTLFLIEDALACRVSLVARKVSQVYSKTTPFKKGSIVVRQRKSNQGDCGKYFLTFNRGQSHSYDRKLTKNIKSLFYNIYSGPTLSHVLKDLAEVRNTHEIIEGEISENSSKQIKYFYFKVDSKRALRPRLVGPGHYGDSVVVNFYQGEFGKNPQHIKSTRLNLNVFVPRIIDISLRSTGGSFNLYDNYELVQFGPLREGLTRSMDIRVRSNTPYDLKFSSQGNGHLVHQKKGSFRQKMKVPYELKLNGVIKSLRGSRRAPKLLFRSHQGTTDASDRIHASFTIKNFPKKRKLPAGDYSDHVLIISRAK